MPDTPHPRDADTEERILAAARRVFVRRGTAGARMQEIAEEAGVNQALLHYYFRSKDRLAMAVFRGVTGHLVPSILQIFGSDTPLPEKVERIVHIYIDTIRTNPFLPGYILSELHHNPERAQTLAKDLVGMHPSQVVRPTTDHLQAQLDAEAAAGHIRPMTAEQFVVNILSLIVFPFAARPLIRVVLGFDNETYDQFLDARRSELPPFILHALRP